MFSVGVRSHMTSCYFAAPLMMSWGQGLIVNTTVAMEEAGYEANLFYWLSKVIINRMTYKMAQELREYNIAVLAVAADWLRTQSILQMYETDDLNAHKNPDLIGSESTEYLGRAVVALATDPDVMKKTGHLVRTRNLGPEYGFTDVDGRQPPFQEWDR